MRRTEKPHAIQGDMALVSEGLVCLQTLCVLGLRFCTLHVRILGAPGEEGEWQCWILEGILVATDVGIRAATSGALFCVPPVPPGIPPGIGFEHGPRCSI